MDLPLNVADYFRFALLACYCLFQFLKYYPGHVFQLFAAGKVLQEVTDRQRFTRLKNIIKDKITHAV